MDRETRRELNELAARLADGDRDAFEPVFRLVHPLIRDFARRALGSGADADDVTQHAMLRVFTRASELDRERDALTWMLAITAFEVRTLRRRRQRRREESDDTLAVAAIVD